MKKWCAISLAIVQCEYCETQLPASISWVAFFTFRLFVTMVTSPFISIVWCFRPYKPYIFWKLIIWWWQWPRRILTKRQIQRQRHTYTDKDKYKVLPRPNVCYIYQKQGVQGFKILYWLSSFDDKDKDMVDIEMVDMDMVDMDNGHDGHGKLSSFIFWCFLGHWWQWWWYNTCRE